MEGIYCHIHDMKCLKGNCGDGEYPKRCQCGGLIHAELDNETREGKSDLVLFCDHCGNDFEIDELDDRLNKRIKKLETAMCEIADYVPANVTPSEAIGYIQDIVDKAMGG
jgi:hypothetical protein